MFLVLIDPFAVIGNQHPVEVGQGDPLPNPPPIRGRERLRANPVDPCAPVGVVVAVSELSFDSSSLQADPSRATIEIDRMRVRGMRMPGS